MKKPGGLTAELAAQLEKDLNSSEYTILYDHNNLKDNAGNIVSWFGDKYGREAELSQLDIAIVEKGLDSKAIVLVETEETNDRPKAFLGDIFGFLFGEHISYKGNCYQVGDFTTLILMGINTINHEKRNQDILEKADKVRGILNTKNAPVGKVDIKTFSNEEEFYEQACGYVKKYCLK